MNNELQDQLDHVERLEERNRKLEILTLALVGELKRHTPKRLHQKLDMVLTSYNINQS